MQQTPWAKRNTGSSLASDRIQPQRAPNQPKKGTKYNVAAQTDVPKSKEIKRLERLVKALHAETAGQKDPKGGCFCLARTHPISPYAPMCTACGLILCSINIPAFACPSCLTPIMTPTRRTDLIRRLEEQIETRLDWEEAERGRVIDERKRAAGAFPTLAGGGTPSHQQQHRPPVIQPAVPQTHKVLSLNSKTKKVLVSSYTTKLPVDKGKEKAPKEPEDPEPYRVPPPSSTVLHASRKANTTSSPWENLREGEVRYVPIRRLGAEEGDGEDEEGGGGESKNARRRKARRKGKEPGTGPPGSAQTSAVAAAGPST